MYTKPVIQSTGITVGGGSTKYDGYVIKQIVEGGGDNVILLGDLVDLSVLALKGPRII